MTSALSSLLHISGEVLTCRQLDNNFLLLISCCKS